MGTGRAFLIAWALITPPAVSSEIDSKLDQILRRSIETRKALTRPSSRIEFVYAVWCDRCQQEEFFRKYPGENWRQEIRTNVRKQSNGLLAWSSQYQTTSTAASAALDSSWSEYFRGRGMQPPQQSAALNLTGNSKWGREFRLGH